jgi:hypothetical protein
MPIPSPSRGHLRSAPSLPFVGLALFAAIAATACGQLRAQTADVLLEKAVYFEQTRGDLEQAVTLYKQVVDDQRRSGPKAARAQYHLGLCLWKMGRISESQQMFRELAQFFPEEKELVSAAARFLSEGRDLMPACWEDGETLEYTLEFQTGVEAGYLAVSAHQVMYEGRPVWRFLSQQNAPNYGGPSKRYVYVDRETFQPYFNLFSHPVVGEFETLYRDDRVTITSAASGATSIKEVLWFGPVYDYEQHWHLLRQLPLKVGYRVSLPVVCCAEGEIAELELRVTGIEEIATPAGTYECFRVETRTGRTGMQAVLWYTTDEHRYLVGFDEWVVQGRLRSISTRGRDEAASFHSQRMNITLSAPPGWFFYDRLGPGRPGQDVVYVLEPSAAFDLQIRMQETETVAAPEPADASDIAERQLQEDALRFKGLEARPTSWSVERLPHRTEARVLADYSDGDQTRVAYLVCVMDRRLVIRFIGHGPADRHREIQAAVDALGRSYRMK